MTLVFLLTNTLMTSKPFMYGGASRLREIENGGIRYAAPALPISRLRGFCRSDGLLGGVVQVVRGRDLEARVAQQLAALLDIGTFEPHHHRNLQAHFLDRRDDAFGDQVATHDPAENVDQDAIHLGRREDQLERRGHALCRRTAADVEKVRSEE